MTSQNDDQIRNLIKTHAEYHEAPVDLHREIAALIITKPKRTCLDWVKTLELNLPQLASGALMGAALATLITSQLLSNQANQESMYLAILADHGRAVVSQQTIEVKSSDQHTVKPWLASQLGYSPQIVDLSAQDFPLIGGRRGFIGTMPVAVAVYAYHQHEIDVYVLTQEIYQKFPSTLDSKNGFNLTSWQMGDLHYLAVTDMNSALLKQFSQQLKNKQNSL